MNREEIADYTAGYDDCMADMMQTLDEIKAEIEQTSETVNGFLMHDGTKRTVLQIIDKYKAESEEV